MVTHARIDYRPNPLWQGSRNRRGDQVDREFDAALLDLLGDVRLLLRFDNSGATLTDRSKNARTLTWSEDVSAFDTPPVELGSGYAVTFNGTDEEGDTPDSDDLSFGDGSVDQPFSIVALVNPSDATDSTILSKLNVNTGGGEWRFFLDGSDVGWTHSVGQGRGRNKRGSRCAPVGYHVAFRYTPPFCSIL